MSIWEWVRDITGFISAIISMFGVPIIGARLWYYNKNKYQRLSIDMENFVRLLTDASSVGDYKKVREQFLLLDQQIQVTLKADHHLVADSESIVDRLKSLPIPTRENSEKFKYDMANLKPEILGILLKFEPIIHSKK